MKPIYLVISFFMISTSTGLPLAQAEVEGMKHMPLAKESRVAVASGKENLDETSGFGHETSSVEMNNLMMIEGSGAEGMDMEMDMDTGTQKP